MRRWWSAIGDADAFALVLAEEGGISVTRVLVPAPSGKALSHGVDVNRRAGWLPIEDVEDDAWITEVRLRVATRPWARYLPPPMRAPGARPERLLLLIQDVVGPMLKRLDDVNRVAELALPADGLSRGSRWMLRQRCGTARVVRDTAERLLGMPCAVRTVGVGRGLVLGRSRWVTTAGVEGRPFDMPGSYFGGEQLPRGRGVEIAIPSKAEPPVRVAAAVRAVLPIGTALFWALEPEGGNHARSAI